MHLQTGSMLVNAQMPLLQTIILKLHLFFNYILENYHEKSYQH